MLNKIFNKENVGLWLILFCVLNITFAFYQFTFFWGDHDWDWIKGTSQVLSLNTGMFEGRYGKFILNVALFGGQVLPFLNNLIAFLLLAIGGVLLTYYWQIKNTVNAFLVAIMPLVAPYVLGWLYFPINILGNFFAVSLVTTGLILNQSLKIRDKIIAVICFLLALGVYPSVMEMMIICFCFQYILVSEQDLKQVVKNALLIVLSLVLFKLLLMILGKYNFIYADYYNLKTVSVLDLIYRAPKMLILVLQQLITTIPFIPFKLKLAGVVISLLALSILSRQQTIFWLTALITTVLSTWLTTTPEETAYMPRVNFYGLNFFLAGSLAVILSKKGWQQNIGLILGILYISLSITADIDAQKNWFLGKTAEEQLVNRLSLRIKETSNNILIPVVAGELSLRPRYYSTPYQKESPYLLNRPLMVRHIPSGMFNFYEAEQLFYGTSQISHLSPKLYQYLLNAESAWPAASSLYIDDEYAIMLLTKDGIRAIQQQLPK